VAPLAGWKKVVLGLIATIILGAVGSGLWDLAGKPATQWFGQAILTGATLGSSAIKDATYREAAKGFHEASALALVGLISGASLGAWGGFMGYLTVRTMRPKSTSKSEHLNHLKGEALIAD
jgi:hypothetical protein